MNEPVTFHKTNPEALRAQIAELVQQYAEAVHAPKANTKKSNTSRFKFGHHTFSTSGLMMTHQSLLPLSPRLW